MVPEKIESLGDVGVGTAIRRNRLRAGLTQVQLAKSIARSGKFLSEVETGKARITQRDLERLADALGVSIDKMLDGDDGPDDPAQWGTPRRIREVQPSGLTILSFAQLVSHLDRSGWLRGSKIWMVTATEFPEENDLALVEQLAALIATKDVSLRYVFEADRLCAEVGSDLNEIQGTRDVLPESLQRALGWSSRMQPYLDPASGKVIGYATTQPLSDLAQTHTLLWVETEDVSWSDVMPLLYCRASTRTFENPSDSSVFWYHLPRAAGWKVLLGLAQQLNRLRPKAMNFDSQS
jgi:transcriptional regulator with XRE-family HTH domain